MRNATNIYTCIMIAAMITAYSCNPTMVPLKVKYHETPVVLTSSKPIDSIWSNLTRIFTKNGLPIKNIDKKRGIILTTKNPINSVYTFEDKDGQLMNPQAWVVLKKVFNKKNEWKPKDIYGQWNIQVTETEKGTTAIKIDPIVNCTYSPNAFTTDEIRGQSTGKLEKLIEQSLNNN